MNSFLKKIQVLFFFLAIGGRVFAQDNALKVTTFKLDNGLTVILNEDHTRTQIFGAVAVKAGSKYDPKDATGMAHYLEHMCFKGTEEMGTTDYAREKPLLDSIMILYDQLGQTKDENERAAIQAHINEVSVRAAQYAIPNEMDKLLKSIGSTDVNAFTSFEEVVYHNTFPAHQVDKWLDIYAQRFIKPVFRLFQPELEIVYEEKNRGSDNFQNVIFEKYLASFFRNHPYGTQTTIGLTEHLKNPSLRKMQEYYNTYFVANNMALVMSGDFETDKIILIIKEKFGRWRSAPVPAFPKYDEAPFKGREEVDINISPIKIGILGFRTVPNLHQDEEPIEIVNYMLSNQAQTGYIDQLSLDNKIQFAGVFATPLNDHGATNIFFAPKIVGQSLQNAEQLIMTEIAKVRDGKFEDAQLQTAKNNLRAEFYKKLESSDSRALYMVQCFISGQDWNEFMKYPDKINAITREQVIAIAKKYFGSNYLAFYSRTGFPPKDKLKKPGFKPVAGKDTLKSEYARKFESLPDAHGTPVFVDFKNDFSTAALKNGGKLFVAGNPVNQLFEARWVFDVNMLDLHKLDAAVQYMMLIGADTLSNKSFKREMSALGCNYSFSLSKNKMYITLSGLEENAAPATQLLQLLMTKPVADPAKIKLLVSNFKASRKLEFADAESAAGVLNNYLLYGENSDDKLQTSLRDLKKTRPDELIQIMKQAMTYRLSIHYSGKNDLQTVKEMVTKYDFIPEISKKPVHAPIFMTKYPQPTINVLYRRDARQTHLYYYGKGPDFQKERVPYAMAFNSYFGNDMSGILFQEIRELRSLAYSTYFYYRSMSEPGETDMVAGYIGCQGDKTKDALNELNVLVRNMPEKTERMASVKNSLVDQVYVSRPFFRYVTLTVENWQEMGFAEDPNKAYAERFGSLKFDDIDKFYKQYIQSMPLSMAIVGSKENVPVAELKKMGKVVILKQRDIAVK
jgi:zinc protease